MNKSKDLKHQTTLNTSKSKKIEKVEYTHDQLFKALSFTEDMLDRSQIPFLLLKETGKAVYDRDKPLSGDALYVGIQERYLVKYLTSTLKSLLPEGYKWERGKIEFEVDGVPVKIAILKEFFHFFKYPEKIPYQIADFYIPNPFMEYYKVKDIVS